MTRTIQPPRRATIASVNNYLEAIGEIVRIYFDSCNDWKISKYRVGRDGTNYELGRTRYHTARQFLDAYLNYR